MDKTQGDPRGMAISPPADVHVHIVRPCVTLPTNPAPSYTIVEWGIQTARYNMYKVVMVYGRKVSILWRQGHGNIRLCNNCAPLGKLQCSGGQRGGASGVSTNVIIYSVGYSVYTGPL